MARLRSDLWVAAFLRSENSGDAAAVVGRRGAAEAGAIFIVIDRLDGKLSLYGPAPQSLAGPEETGDRRFELLLDGAEPLDARDMLDRQIRFDSDCWIVETERRRGMPAMLLVVEGK